VPWKDIFGREPVLGPPLQEGLLVVQDAVDEHRYLRALKMRDRRRRAFESKVLCRAYELYGREPETRVYYCGWLQEHIFDAGELGCLQIVFRGGSTPVFRWLKLEKQRV